jgi:hypothetical protein
MQEIESSNKYAVKLGFQFYNQTNSALKELLNVSLGKVINKNPELFLKSLKSYSQNFADKDYYGLLLNHGDDFVDKREESISETKKRIKSIESVNLPELKETKETCLTVLNGFLKK